LIATKFYLFIPDVDKRMTVNELPGNVRVTVVPENFTISAFGETFVGSSNVFSSGGLAEVSTMALPLLESLSQRL
jgi:hypothetical protein